MIDPERHEAFIGAMETAARQLPGLARRVADDPELLPKWDALLYELAESLDAYGVAFGYSDPDGRIREVYNIFLHAAASRAIVSAMRNREAWWPGHASRTLLLRILTPSEA